MEYRQKSDFNIPNDLQMLSDTKWYKDSLEKNNLKECANMKDKAQKVLITIDKENIFNKKAMIDHHNHNKKLAYIIMDSDGNGFPMNYAEFSGIDKIKEGTIIEIIYSKLNPQKPLSFSISDSKELAGISKIFNGSLTKKPNENHAFIKAFDEEIYVPPNLAKSYQSNTPYIVTCRAIKHSQGRTKWKAIEISKKHKHRACKN